MKYALRDRRAIVTGASGGLGRALSLELARRGVHVLAVARRQPLLESLRREIESLPGECHVVVGDVTDAATRQAALNAARERWGGVDILINNAGVGASGPFAGAETERMRRIFEVNLFAAAELTRLALPYLRAGGQGVVVQIGSVLGHVAMPFRAEYCASKFALRGFSDALRAELRPVGVRLLHVSPSTTDTEFFDNQLEEKIERRFANRPKMPVEVAARQIVNAIARGRTEVTLSFGGKLLVWSHRIAPRLAGAILARLS